MRTFAQPNYSEGQVCPLCKTDSDWEIILVQIEWTQDDWLAEAVQVHTACIQDNLRYDKESDMIYI